MRIIGGELKGRKFNPPAKNWPTRPTTDFAKEGLFNILTNHFDFAEIKVLDLFGGTGSHSYEFISRGCEDVTYVDRFGPCVDFVKTTARNLQIEHFIKIIKMDAFRFIGVCKEQFDYIFAGPPYELPTIDLLPDLVFKHQILKNHGWFVLEHNPNHSFKKHPNYFDERHYGKTIFSFFKYPDFNEND